jgi:signal transduction histidine kinase
MISIIGFGAVLPSVGHFDRQSFSLAIMSEGAKEVNGRVEVKSAPGKGTKIVDGR